MDLASDFQVITAHNFCTVSITRLQKYVTGKKGFSSCDQGAIITDFETGEIFCSHCGFVLFERAEDSGFECHPFLGIKTIVEEHAKTKDEQEKEKQQNGKK